MADNTVVNAAPVVPAAPGKADATPAVPAKTDVAPKAEPKAAAPIVEVDENGVSKAPKKIFKLNVNGKEVEYDASNEDKLKADLQKVFGIEEKARTTAQKADMAEKLLGMLQNDPIGFEKQCKLQGIDATKLATEILYNQLRIQNMTPEQRELEEYKEREAEAKKIKEQQEADSKKAEIDRKTQEWAQKFEKECEIALNENKIPKTRLSLALIAQYVDAGLAAGKELAVADVLPYVHRDLKEIHKSTMESLDGDALLEYVGETLSNKIAKARVDRYNRVKTTAKPVEEKNGGKATPTSKEKELDNILKTKGRTAYFKALRQWKSEQGIGLQPGLQQ